jgi:sugar/nucleoside kinase (ribokinase family)
LIVALSSSDSSGAREYGVPAKFDVVGVGCVAVDTLGIYDGEIVEDEKMQCYQTLRQSGGLVGTGLAAVKRLGGSARFIGKLGDDDHAQFIVRDFDREGIDTSCIRRVSGMSAIRSIGVISPTRHTRTIFYCLDNVPVLEPSEMNRDEVLAGKVIFVDGFVLQAAIQAAEWGREAGRKVIMDAELTEPDNDILAGLCTHVVASIAFARSRLGACDFKEAARQLYDMYAKGNPDKTIGVTAGSEGSYFVSSEGEYHQPIFEVEVLDTTGCGDVFHGAFAFGLSRDWDLKQITKFAAAVAAIKCRKLGGRAGIPSYDETECFISASRLK